MTCSSDAAGSAPGWEKTRMPSRKAISVGIEVIRYEPPPFAKSAAPSPDKLSLSLQPSRA